MMNVQLDLRKASVVQNFSEILQKQSVPIEIGIGDVDFCPNRIVPIVALADLHRRKGGHISFAPCNGPAAKAACFGFLSSQMNPSGEITRPFGRVWRFDNGDELNKIVTAVELETNRTTRLEKGVRQCFGWCLNEVMDNVLTHSRRGGDAFGYIMVQYVPAGNLLKACVFDTGIGLKDSFVGSAYTPATSADAICLAVGKNITSGPGQGNGLYGLKRLVGQSPDGRLQIRSDGGVYVYDSVTGNEVVRESWSVAGYPGTTLVDFQIRCDGELSFSEVFPEVQGLVDLWAENRETEDGTIRLDVCNTVSGCGSRANGRELRTLVENLIEADKKRVIIDFGNIETCSSGFVDELLGKLLEKYDFVAFSQLISIVGIQGIVALLINHSIAQRIASKQNGLQATDSSEAGTGDEMLDIPESTDADRVPKPVETEEGHEAFRIKDFSGSLAKTFKEEKAKP